MFVGGNGSHKRNRNNSTYLQMGCATGLDRKKGSKTVTATKQNKNCFHSRFCLCKQIGLFVENEISKKNHRYGCKGFTEDQKSKNTNTCTKLRIRSRIFVRLELPLGAVQILLGGTSTNQKKIFFKQVGSQFFLATLVPS